MNPGQLSERITIKTPSSSSLDRFGQTVVAYASASMWADVKRQSGNETSPGGLVLSQATYVFTVRDRQSPTINEKAVITYESKEYNVVFVDEPTKGILRLTGERI